MNQGNTMQSNGNFDDVDRRNSNRIEPGRPVVPAAKAARGPAQAERQDLRPGRVPGTQSSSGARLSTNKETGSQLDTCVYPTNHWHHLLIARQRRFWGAAESQSWRHGGIPLE